MLPQPSTNPISTVFSGDTGYMIEGVSDHHMPRGFNDYVCHVHEMKIDVVNLQTMKLHIKFSISGDEEELKNLYAEQNWKFTRTENVLRNNRGTASQLRAPTPLFGVMLNQHLQVVNAQMNIRHLPVDPPILFDQSCDLTLLPDSFPPLAEMGKEDYYSYYAKKTTLFYSDLHLKRLYEVDIELESNGGMFEFAPLFPFGKVIYESITEDSQTDLEIQVEGMRVRPTRSDSFPEWYEESLEHKKTFEPRMPRMSTASPFRGEVPLFNMLDEIALGGKTKKDIERSLDEATLDLAKPVEMNNFETVRFGFIMTIPLEKDLEINVRSIQRPLPPRIYEQMQQMPSYQDVLVRYDIFNFSNKKMRLKVETEIIDVTDRVRKTVFVHGMKNEKKKKARVVEFQCPRLKRGMLEELKKPEKATMLCKVTDEDTGQVLFEETRNIDLLPNDEMVWELRDVRSNTRFDLHEFICAWITPRDAEGLVEQVRVEAAKLHPTGAFGASTSTLGDYESHARAVYDALSNRGMRYVNQPFSSVSMDSSQRVVLPEVVLKHNAGNCIDLTVLFASILEGAGMYSLIFLTEEHAFIGWGNKHNSEQILFLETTMVGSRTFDEAVAAGTQYFTDNIALKGGPRGMMPFPLIGAERGCFIVDTAEVRFSGKVSARNT